MDDLKKNLSEGILLFYGYSYKNLPEQIHENIKTRTHFYFKDKYQKNRIEDSVSIKKYKSYQEIGLEDSDIVFLDQDAVKGLLIGYPTNAKYVLTNCNNIRYLPWIIIGLFRRIILGKVLFYGFKRLTQNNKSSFWLVLGRKSLKNSNEFYLSKNLGIQGFLEYLHKANIEYVVPRHFESLPCLHREGGDLDIIVSDKDEHFIKNFLIENSGSIRVDVWSVSRKNYNQTTYMPPNIAEEVIKNSIEGKAFSKIPNQLDAFRCLVFHALYHKGFGSGLPSEYTPSGKFKNNNDYLSAIKNMAFNLNLEINFTMEDLDEYMQASGWGPSSQMSILLSKNNEWIRSHFFKKSGEVKTTKTRYIKNMFKHIIKKIFTH